MANRVYNDLNETPFTLDYEGFTLYFSSIFHTNKFKNNIKRCVRPTQKKEKYEKY